jgi:hypothetical protein
VFLPFVAAYSFLFRILSATVADALTSEFGLGDSVVDIIQNAVLPRIKERKGRADVRRLILDLLDYA